MKIELKGSGCVLAALTAGCLRDIYRHFRNWLIDNIPSPFSRRVADSLFSLYPTIPPYFSRRVAVNVLSLYPTTHRRHYIPMWPALCVQSVTSLSWQLNITPLGHVDRGEQSDFTVGCGNWKYVHYPANRSGTQLDLKESISTLPSSTWHLRAFVPRVVRIASTQWPDFLTKFCENLVA